MLHLLRIMLHLFLISQFLSLCIRLHLILILILLLLLLPNLLILVFLFKLLFRFSLSQLVTLYKILSHWVSVINFFLLFSGGYDPQNPLRYGS